MSTERSGPPAVGGARSILALLLLACFGCMDHPSSAPGEVEPVPRVHPEEGARIDGTEHVLRLVRRAALRSDGLLAVDQRGAETVLLFSREGEKLGELGGRGQGPGEFTGINAMGWTGDTLWVHDASGGRLTRFRGLPGDPRIAEEVRTGAFRPSQPTRLDGQDIPSYGFVRLRAVYPGGDLLAEMLLPQVPDASEFANTALYARLRQDGSIRRVLARVHRPPEEVRVVWTSESRLAFGVPWVLQPSVAVSGDGRRIAVVTPVVEEDRPIETFEVTMLDGSSGDTLYRRRHPLDAVPIPEAAADSAVEARVEGITRYEALFPDVDLVGRYRRDVVIPPIYPPFGEALVGPDGWLWIHQVASRESPTGSYLVLDEEGDLVGEVMVRAGVRAAGEDYVWAGVQDSLGVPSLVRYDVEWAEAITLPREDPAAGGSADSRPAAPDTG